MKTKLQWFAAILTVTLAFTSNVFSQNGSTDPTIPGPFAVSSAIYDYGDTALTFQGFPGPVEFRGSVHYPTDLSGPPHPLIVLLHGRHSVCYNGTNLGGFVWPCTNGDQPIPSFQGYDYLAQNLASYGYIVISISADGINAVDASVNDAGAEARAELIQQHLNLWNQFNTTGAAPFGTLFVGKVDMTRVGTMGHSRGGEGVVKSFLLNQSLGSPYGIRAVFSLAPIDFNGFVPTRIAFGVLLPYCDGDVDTLEGIHYYDSARYAVPGDPTPKHAFLVMGADHNFYNTVWTPGEFPAGASDDWGAASDPYCGTGPGNQRLTPDQEQKTGLALIAAFMRTYVGGEHQFLPVLVGASQFPVAPATIHTSYQAPDSSAVREDVNRLTSATNLTTSTLGTPVNESGLTPYSVCGGVGETVPCVNGLQLGQQPHNDGLAAPGFLSQLITGWGSQATYTYSLPIGKRLVKLYQALQFRAAVNFADPRNSSLAVQDLTVTLTDGNGRSASINVNKAAPGKLFFPPGATGPVPRIFLNTVRIPLSSFASINLSDVRTIQFKFDRTAAGGLMITDIAFASPPVF